MGPFQIAYLIDKYSHIQVIFVFVETCSPKDFNKAVKHTSLIENL